MPPKWIKCYRISTVTAVVMTCPKESGDYWVTDGTTVHKAHFDLNSEEWGIYQPDKNGVIKYCYQLGDMNFRVKAYAPMTYPPRPERFA